jgi:peptide deformylase
MTRPLIYYGNPILRQRASPIEAIDDSIRQLAEDMLVLIRNHNGAGLAAPQAGVSVRLFIACPYQIFDDGRWELTAPRVYINPKIEIISDEMDIMDEGCLSLPGIRGDILRPKKIRIEALNMDWQQVVEEHDWINARMMMHENDHLNGVLYIDRLHPKERRQLDQQLQMIKKKYN